LVEDLAKAQELQKDLELAEVLEKWKVQGSE